MGTLQLQLNTTNTEVNGKALFDFRGAGSEVKRACTPLHWVQWYTGDALPQHPDRCRDGLKDHENGAQRGKLFCKLAKPISEQNDCRRTTSWCT